MQSAHVEAVNRNGNLHVKIVGDFDDVAAQGAALAIDHEYRGLGNVFVNTQQVKSVLPSSAASFKESMATAKVDAANLFVVGENGAPLVPDGSRMIARPPKKKKCSGCGNCKCGKKKKRG